MPWSARFDEPIKLPNGRKLVTLKDAGTYITKLPKAEHSAPEWLAAMEALILVAENNGQATEWQTAMEALILPLTAARPCSRASASCRR